MHRPSAPPPSARGRATVAILAALALVAVVLRQRAASSARQTTCTASGVSHIWAADLAQEYSAKQQEIHALQAQWDALSGTSASASRHVILYQAQTPPQNISKPFLFIAVRALMGVCPIVPCCWRACMCSCCCVHTTQQCTSTKCPHTHHMHLHICFLPTGIVHRQQQSQGRSARNVDAQCTRASPRALHPV